jgi:hypothetical protein
MPSSWTPSLALELQETGENTNIWGSRNNANVISKADRAIAGVVTISTAGATILTAANGGNDQATQAAINYTGTSLGTITIPGRSKITAVRAATADCTITNGSSSATVKAGEVRPLLTDGTDIWLFKQTDMGGSRMTGGASPINPTDFVTKQYADNLAFNSVNLIRSDGSQAGWQFVEISDVQGLQGELDGLADDIDTEAARVTGLAIAFAVAL